MSNEQMKTEKMKEIKKIAELLKKETKIYREMKERAMKVVDENLLIEVATLLQSNVDDRKFEAYWPKLEKDYSQFSSEKEKEYLSNIKKTFYSLREKKERKCSFILLL